MNIEELQAENERLKLQKSLLEEGDRRWASKLTELIVYAMSGMILLGTFGAIIGLVLKK